MVWRLLPESLAGTATVRFGDPSAGPAAPPRDRVSCCSWVPGFISSLHPALTSATCHAGLQLPDLPGSLKSMCPTDLQSLVPAPIWPPPSLGVAQPTGPLGSALHEAWSVMPGRPLPSSAPPGAPLGPTLAESPGSLQTCQPLLPERI